MNRLTTQDRQMYAEFRTEFRYCWACRYQPLPREFSTGMLGKFECAHIIGGAGRVADRRAIVGLCKCHHMIQEGETFRYEGKPLPKLTRANMLWLKQMMDGEFYDLEFIRERLMAKNGMRVLPEPEPVEPIGSNQ